MTRSTCMAQINTALFRKTREGLNSCTTPRYFEVVEFNNGTNVVVGNKSFFFAHGRAIEYLRFHAGMMSRSSKTTRNFLRRTVRAAGMRSNL